MQKEYLLMNEKERRRLEILSRVKSNEINLVDAATIMGVSYRQAIRMKNKFLTEGDASLVHKNRGRTSNRAKPDFLKQTVLNRYRENYSDFGPTFACEKLAEDGLIIDPCTLWRWLTKSGDWHKKQTRKTYRKLRESRQHFGELVQLDGSYHEWFESRAGKATLMNMMDDATGISHSFLCEQETTENAFKVLLQWIQKYGVPYSLYTDRRNIYCGLGNSGELTQFGKSCKELGISIIFANSPQAKGKIERSNGVYQDRLVKELRLKNISTIDEANNYLHTDFINRLNNKFSIKPVNEIDLHTEAPTFHELLKILSLREKRRVGNDWTIKWKNMILQIANQPGLPKAGGTVEVREYLDGSLHIFYDARELKFNQVKKRFSANDEDFKTTKQKRIEYYLTIATLKKQGCSTSKISKKLNVCENTVNSYIKRGGPPQGIRTRTSKLAPYDKLIRTWLEGESLETKFVHERLVKLGFKVSLRQIRRYVNRIKEEFSLVN